MMKTFTQLMCASIACMLLSTPKAHAQLSPYDENAPVGWASIDLDGGCTGSNNQNPITVSTYDDLKKALSNAAKGTPQTIYISGEIYCPEKIRVNGVKNCSIYGLPGALLYNYTHSDVADANPGFYCQSWSNCIIRNVTIKGPGAYDISGCDNISLVGTTNIWIDHCDIQDGMDGNLDAKDKSDNITVSWCKFSYLIPPFPNSESPDHRCSSMWGSSNNRDETGNLDATFVNCWWFHGCGQRCPRIRFGKVHIANCLWENGTADDPAQYCVGIGHCANLYIENGDFTKTVLKTGQSDMRGHNKYYLTEKKVYNLTITGCLGEADAQEKGAGYTGEFYNPYTYDSNYKCRVYPAAKVANILRDPNTGAGATLDEDLLATRGNDHYGEETTAIQGVAAADEARVVGISYFGINGAKYATPQKGLNIIRYEMSDGTTRSQKIFK